MLEIWHRHCRLCIAAALVPASLLGGCFTQLAVQEPYFSPLARVGQDNLAGSKQTLAAGRSMQKLQLACARAGSDPAASDDAEPDAAGGKALEARCAAWRGRSPESHGAIQNAYGRWATDNLRPLPDASDTAASAAGG